jgi:cytoskeleton protein RodZ
MMDTMQPNITTDTPAIGIGARLKAAREALHMTQKDAATRLHLSVKFIVLMENEEFNGDTPITFLRGYLRSYGRLLNLSEQEVTNATDQLGTYTPAKQTKPILRVSLSNNNEPYIKWITYLIGIVLIALVASWWSSHTKEANKNAATPSPAAAQPSAQAAPSTAQVNNSATPATGPATTQVNNSTTPAIAPAANSPIPAAMPVDAPKTSQTVTTAIPLPPAHPEASPTETLPGTQANTPAAATPVGNTATTATIQQRAATPTALPTPATNPTPAASNVVTPPTPAANNAPSAASAPAATEAPATAAPNTQSTVLDPFQEMDNLQGQTAPSATPTIPDNMLSADPNAPILSGTATNTAAEPAHRSSKATKKRKSSTHMNMAIPEPGLDSQDY